MFAPQRSCKVNVSDALGIDPQGTSAINRENIFHLAWLLNSTNLYAEHTPHTIAPFLPLSLFPTPPSHLSLSLPLNCLTLSLFPSTLSSLCVLRVTLPPSLFLIISLSFQYSETQKEFFPQTFCRYGHQECVKLLFDKHGGKGQWLQRRPVNATDIFKEMTTCLRIDSPPATSHKETRGGEAERKKREGRRRVRQRAVCLPSPSPPSHTHSLFL